MPCGRPVRCTPHQVDDAGAFTQSLTTAVTAHQLHPVDQYDGFARLEQQGMFELQGNRSVRGY